MAFVGQKSGYGYWLKDAFDWSESPIVTVDPFAGSMSLTGSFCSAFGGIQTSIIGESFEALRNLYQYVERPEIFDEMGRNFVRLADLDGWDEVALAEEFRIPRRVAGCVASAEGEGSEHLRRLGHLWRQLRIQLRQGAPDAYAGLQACSMSNSMRHGPNGHNVLPDVSKILRLKKKRSFISPLDLSVRPTEVFPSWEGAVNSFTNGTFAPIDAALLLDPPYIGAKKIYPKEDAVGSAVPPVELGMQQGYATIAAFNYFSQDLCQQFRAVANRYGYRTKMKETPFRQRINNREGEAKVKRVEACWFFELDF